MLLVMTEAKAPKIPTKMTWSSGPVAGDFGATERVRLGKIPGIKEPVAEVEPAYANSFGDYDFYGWTFGLTDAGRELGLKDVEAEQDYEEVREAEVACEKLILAQLKTLPKYQANG